MASPPTSSHPYTCLGCNIAFDSSQLQRSHFASDLHRYNAKRRIAGLTPIQAEVFSAKFSEAKGQKTILTKSDSVYHCKICS